LGAPIDWTYTAAIRSLVKEQEDDEEDSIIVEDTATNNSTLRDHCDGSETETRSLLTSKSSKAIGGGGGSSYRYIDDHLLQHPRNDDHEKWDPFKKTSYQKKIITNINSAASVAQRTIIKYTLEGILLEYSGPDL
jgi:hypothetical protein